MQYIRGLIDHLEAIINGPLAYHTSSHCLVLGAKYHFLHMLKEQTSNLHWALVKGTRLYIPRELDCTSQPP